MARRRKRGEVVRDARQLARKASARQRCLYGLNGAKVPAHERWKYELDPKYLAALAKDPAAAQFLSVFTEELARGVYQEGEPHIHELEEFRVLDAERKARAHNLDVMSFDAYRCASMEGVAAAGYDPDDWLARQTGVEPGKVEDDLIDAIDRRRAIALRLKVEGTEGEDEEP